MSSHFHDSIRHQHPRPSTVPQKNIFPTRPNFDDSYARPITTPTTASTTRSVHAPRRQLMYSTPQFTFSGSGQTPDLGFPSSEQTTSHSSSNNLFEPSSGNTTTQPDSNNPFDYDICPADWGMQFQGSNSNILGGGPLAAHQRQKQGGFRGQQHQRNTSESTINSAGPSSPSFQSFSSSPYIHNENSPGRPTLFDEASSYLQKNSSVTNQDQFQLYPDIGYVPSTLSHTPAVHLDMKHMALDQHHATVDDMPDFSHSSRQSVSSRGQDSPSTPKMDEMDAEHQAARSERPGLYKISTNDYRQAAPRVELFRTESAAAADELYNPDFSSQPAPSSSHLHAQPQANTDANYLSPNRTLVQDRIRTANDIRSQSPQQSSSRREKSPFRPGSPLAPADGATQEAFKSPSAFFTSAADARRQQIEEASAREVNRHYKKPTLQREPTKTMSPRDALLDYNDTDAASDIPLFPETVPAGYSKHVGPSSEFFTSNYINSANQAFGGVATQGQQTPNMGSFRPQNGNSGAASSNAPDFSFLQPQPQQQLQPQPAVSSQTPINPYTASQYRSAASYLTAENTPDFPAHLASMESSVSDAPVSSQGSAASDAMMQRPADTSAATGGYTCTFHNCPQRFDSPAKLQRHKRDVHHTNHSRDISNSSTAPHSVNASVSPDPSHDGSEGSAGSVGSGMTSAALAARNSQSGPHKCSRINPSTGKPCNSIFSRPYDLTRHEDTIHNRQKVKVRCQYCREEKTFSRNDALTRHMRVVHPEISWEVKRGGRGGSVRSDQF